MSRAWDDEVERLVSYIIRSGQKGRTQRQLINKFGGKVTLLYRAALKAGYSVYYENIFDDGWTLLFLCHDKDPTRKEG